MTGVSQSVRTERLPVRADVVAVVVNWNTSDLLDACLSSLAADVPDGVAQHIVVVDNGSEDGSAALVRDKWPAVQLIVNPQNEGYTRANNRAIRSCGGDYLLLINADAQVRPGCLDSMVARMEADPGAAVVGPRLVYGDGTWQRWTAGQSPGVASVAAFYLFMEKLPGPFRRHSLFLADDVSEPFEPEWVSSACMLVRRAALDEIGLMDETYFCYMDDVDLCQRARDAGWRVWYEPGAEAVHLMGQSTRRQTGRASPSAIRNFNHYVRAQRGPATGACVRAAEVAGFATRAAVYAARSLWKGAPDRRQAGDHLQNLRVALTRGTNDRDRSST